MQNETDATWDSATHNAERARKAEAEVERLRATRACECGEDDACRLHVENERLKARVAELEAEVAALHERAAALQARVNELNSALYHRTLERDRAREELQLTLIAVDLLRTEHAQELAALRQQPPPLLPVVRLVDPPQDMVPGPRPAVDGHCPECDRPIPGPHRWGCGLGQAEIVAPAPDPAKAQRGFEVAEALFGPEPGQEDARG